MSAHATKTYGVVSLSPAPLSHLEQTRSDCYVFGNTDYQVLCVNHSIASVMQIMCWRNKALMEENGIRACILAVDQTTQHVERILKILTLDELKQEENES